MAILTAYYQYDVGDLRLKTYANRFQSHLLEDNVNNTTQDKYTVFTWNEALQVTGTGFGYTGTGQMTEGQVSGLGEYFYNEVEGADEWFYDPRYTITNAVKVSSADFNTALNSAQTGDDFALLAKMLSGKDTFRLSNEGDVANGYGGNDVMFGFGGFDTLKGGNGNDRLYGNWGNDRLVGNSGKDILRGGPGRDKEFGGGGADVFRFIDGDDVDVIFDFQWAGQMDRVDVSDLSTIRNWWDLSNNHMEQNGNDTWIDALNGDLIILKNVDMNDLSKTDFIFV